MAAPKRRKYTRVETRRAAWQRANSRCEQCAKPLVTRKVVRVAASKLEFVMHLWSGHACWRCHHKGRVLMLYDTDHYGESFLQRRDVGTLLKQRYPFFHLGYSETMGMEYYANHCENCGALQGDHYVREWVMDCEAEGKKPGHVEILPGIAKWRDPYSYVERKFLHNIHHVDGDPSNTSLENLAILCVDCHRLAHSKQKGGS